MGNKWEGAEDRGSSTIEKIMNLIGAGIETSKNKQPTPSSVRAHLTAASLFPITNDEHWSLVDD
ncbi:hypothetical protein PAMP_017738 [Pampus punctatissimus]